jgi:ABC-type sugar transport system substrate-binding protein
MTPKDWFADAFESSPTPPFKARVLRGERTMSITYHESAEAAQTAAQAKITDLCANPNEIDAGYGHAEDYRIAVGPAVEEQGA